MKTVPQTIINNITVLCRWWTAIVHNFDESPWTYTYVHSLTWECISISAEHMRAHEKNERYFCNPHTSGTRKRCPIFRYGQVGEDSFNSCSFHLAPSLQVPVSVPVPEELAAPPSSRKRARTIVTKLESFTDRSYVQAELLFAKPLPLLFSFACNSSHSSSWPRFVKVCVSTFIVRHDTEIYSYSLAIPSYFFSIALCNFRLSFSLSFF